MITSYQAPADPEQAIIQGIPTYDETEFMQIHQIPRFPLLRQSRFSLGEQLLFSTTENRTGSLKTASSMITTGYRYLKSRKTAMILSQIPPQFAHCHK